MVNALDTVGGKWRVYTSESFNGAAFVSGPIASVPGGMVGSWVLEGHPSASRVRALWNALERGATGMGLARLVVLSFGVYVGRLQSSYKWWMSPAPSA
jgi:hypothetical protein